MISSELNVLYVSLVFQGWITCSAGSNQETLLKHCRLCHGKGANWPCIHTDCVCQLIGKLYYTLPYHSTTGPSNTLRPTFQSVPKIVIPVFFSIQNIQTIPLRWCRLWTRRLPRNLLHRKKHDIVVTIKLHCFVIVFFRYLKNFIGSAKTSWGRSVQPLTNMCLACWNCTGLGRELLDRRWKTSWKNLMNKWVKCLNLRACKSWGENGRSRVHQSPFPPFENMKCSFA